MEAIKSGVATSPVGTPPKARANPLNKDGLVKGQVVEDNDYWSIMAKKRSKKQLHSIILIDDIIEEYLMKDKSKEQKFAKPESQDFQCYSKQKKRKKRKKAEEEQI